MSLAMRCRAVLASLLAVAALAASSALAQSHGPAIAPATAKDLAPPPALVLGPAAEATRLALPAPQPQAVEAIKRANAATALKRVQVGVGRDTATLPLASSAALAWTPVAGGAAARWRVSSEGAAAVRIALSARRMPPGAELRFAPLDAGAPVLGPFAWSALAAGDAPWWSPVIDGEGALVELFVPAGAAHEEAAIAIVQVSHLFVHPAAPRADDLAKASGACQVDVVCRAASDPALASAARSVAKMSFSDATGGSFVCTGTLLNASDNSLVPYFYTANHCIDTQSAASTLTTHWFYETSTCGGGTLSPSYVQVPGGATLLYGDGPSDVSLLRLNAQPPAGAVYAAWDAATVGFGTALTAIHHPAGDVKKVSLGAMGGFGNPGIAGATGSFIRVNWNSLATGVTEGGSSGSGIFSRQDVYRFRGGLLGGPSSCTASSSELYDWYSRFDQAFAGISHYLDPNTSGCTFAIQPTTAAAGSGAGSGTFQVSTGGSCSWAAVSDAAWLTTSSSGAGSGTISYSVAANTSASSRTGTITVGGQRFTVTQAGAAASGPNAVANGDFEGAGGWTESATGGLPIVTRDASMAHSGSGYAWLGGYVDGTDTIFQDVSVPAVQPRLQFWYYIQTVEPGSTVYDVMTVTLENPFTGATLATLATFSNASATNAWRQSSAYDLSAYAGQRVRLRFRATNDFSGVTNFLVDDVVLAGADDTNHTALWWNAGESGWGVNVNHQGDILFATLFTYDDAGRPLWLVMSRGDRQGSTQTYSGELYRTHGPAFDAEPFTPIGPGNFTPVGTMTFEFAGDGTATLSYAVNGRPVRKQIVRQVYGSRAAVCSATTQGRASLANYQDLWWNPSESGWGINLTHQDQTLFATLFTYGRDGQPLWLVMSAGVRLFDGSYAGNLYRTTGPAFDAQPFTPLRPDQLTPVGTMRLQFSDGENGVLEYTVDGARVVKPIVRQVFSSPLPACQS